ncbi:MAG: DegT/DnrJ/EryC1/StrS family aminotransferase [Ignavibacteriaceae bacterium]|nr:DegT/DnrJ/EryC1/StrS family aminotransferase [Ignavibacteriaceae bacterium]
MSYKIPLFDLNYGEEEEKAVIDTLRSKWISTGPRCDEFEKLFAESLDAKYALTVSNCTVSLHLALRLLGIKDDDEVIVPSLTFVASVNAIKYVNAKPVFCDIQSYEDINISPEAIEQAITPKTKAIIVVHFGGFPCDMEKIMGIAQKHNLKIIEDACHGPLSEYQGKKLGTFGDISCFSFFSNKNLSTGEGGMLVTNNEEYYNKAKLLRSHGMTSLSFERSKGHTTVYDVLEFGYNYRLDDIRASIGIVQLKKLKSDLDKRALLREKYIECLENIEQIIIPFKNHSAFVSNYIFPIVLKDSTAEKRDLLRAKLQEDGIQTSIHYPAAHRFSIYKDLQCNLPNTEYVADNEITLPMFGKVTVGEIEYIVASIKKHIQNKI